MFLYFDTIQVLSGQCYKNSTPTLNTTSIRIPAYLFKKNYCKCNLSSGGFVYRGKRIKNPKVRERSRSIKTQKFSQSIFQTEVWDLMSKNNEEALIGLLLLNLQGKSYKMST